jgi:hypothetical protein
MSKIFFATRTLARDFASNTGNIARDAGKDAPEGKRWFVESADFPVEVSSPLVNIVNNPDGYKLSHIGHCIASESMSAALSNVLSVERVFMSRNKREGRYTGSFGPLPVRSQYGRKVYSAPNPDFQNRKARKAEKMECRRYL